MKDLKKQQKGMMQIKALQLYKDGMSYQDIATELGIGKTTVYNWIASSYANFKNNSRVANNSEQNEVEIFQLVQVVHLFISNRV